MGGDSGQGWLAAFLPASARRIRVRDEELANTLRLAGAEVVDVQPDVQIASDLHELDTAPDLIVALAEPPPEWGPRPARALRRAAAVARVRLRARACRRALRRRGFREASIVLWDVDRPLRPATLLDPKQRFPLRALVIARRGAARQTTLEAAAEAAGLEPASLTPIVRQGGVVALSADRVLRVSLGHAEGQLAAQRAALGALARSGADVHAARVPEILASGAAGLASWSLERRLPGETPASPLALGVLADCRDFLVCLHAVGGEPTAVSSPELDAADIEAACGLRDPATLERVGRSVATAVAGLPRGFGHGDFWRENLLAAEGRLTGVVDWASAGPGRLPLLDLLHLTTEDARARGRGNLGPAVVAHLLPWAAAGGDELTRSYCLQVGVAPEPATLEALGLAYWLDFTAGQLRLYADRARSRRWVHDNVELVLAAVPRHWA